MSRPPQPAGGPAPAPLDRWPRRGGSSEGAPERVLDLGRLLLGLVVVSLGSLFLLDSAGALDASRAIDRWWPVVIVARWGGRAIPAGERDDDVVRSTAIFGGSELASTAQRFRGAWLTAIFGGITLDLRDAVPAPQGASVNATAAFGGIEILVPRGWRISMRSTPILGGLEDKTDRTSAPAADAPTLHVDAVAILGGVEIKHDEDD